MRSKAVASGVETLRFAAVLLNPPAPTDALVRALERHHTLIAK
jgi:hypothetical protein